MNKRMISCGRFARIRLQFFSYDAIFLYDRVFKTRCFLFGWLCLFFNTNSNSPFGLRQWAGVADKTTLITKNALPSWIPYHTKKMAVSDKTSLNTLSLQEDGCILLHWVAHCCTRAWGGKLQVTEIWREVRSLHLRISGKMQIIGKYSMGCASLHLRIGGLSQATSRYVRYLFSENS